MVAFLGHPGCQNLHRSNAVINRFVSLQFNKYFMINGCGGVVM